eukprot:CAMPEP_0119275656 /NCGR_PEP_ID=MMETSP1329-20130426/14147_1 /TAXON_ID=114041 /ORGANISM="Genus nov. species nov., Strain RCC1024" /LENGTH=449 /DNA_ID=CAMNT_0007276051 /DNA_START=177 /DNA_END=1522 /DNA_ORIENTATION=+
MSVAFAIKAKKAPAAPKLAAPSVFGAPADDADDGRPPPPRDIVIPLTQNPWAGKLAAKREAEAAKPEAAAAPSSLDEAAAAAIIAEGVGELKKPKEELVIELAAGAADGSQPLLVAAMNPDLKDIADEGDKFRKDVEGRADDIDCASDAYSKVRIDEFGVGMLRGMGWGGLTEEDNARFSDAVPRQRGLGLGAQEKPPEVYDSRGRLREGRTATNKDALKAAASAQSGHKWLGAEKKQETRVQLKALVKGDIVLIRRPRGDKTLESRLDGRRARVVEASDPAAPNKARVELEDDGGRREVVGVAHRALVPDESSKPFREAKRKRDREADKPKKKSKKGRSEPPRPPWLCAGIRVRVGKEGDPLYRLKGRVLDVLPSDSGFRATLLLDDGRRVDEPGYREKHLETALPKDGGPVRAVLGPRKLHTGVLLGRDRRKETCTVRFDDDDAIET